jgi:tRNA modification GTPase
VSTAATWEIQTPGTPGALAVVQVRAGGAEGGIDGVLGRLGVRPVPEGKVGLRDLLGIDQGVVARWAGGSAWLMPHGGVAVLRALAGELEKHGIERAERPDPRAVYPEAADEVEAQMLAALARAASPLAVDLLLDQPRRWREHDLRGEAGQGETNGTRRREDRGTALNRLIDPPLVVAVGPPNVGKSSLVNALAGRSVSVVADQPGTTRDHVGVMIDMAGLVVRYMDTPGLGRRADAIEVEAEELARRIAASADLVLSCGDAGAEPPAVSSGAPTLRAALRSDLGRATWPHDAAVSARTGAGMTDLVALVREALVPAAALADPRPWRFW